jgi:hypothetical protein
MPSQLHEALLLLFRNRPTLAPELMRDALHFELPAFTEARIDSADLTEVKPAEYHADLVVLLLDGVPVYGIVIEVQLSRDQRKRFVWPVYASSLRARLKLPVSLLIVAPDEAIAGGLRSSSISAAAIHSARWCSGPRACPKSLTRRKREPTRSSPFSRRWRTAATTTPARLRRSHSLRS